jgi:uncharacterized protein (DUF736 family)
MATISTFQLHADGSYTGAIKTLTLNVKQAVCGAAEKDNDKSRDFRVFAGQTEFGAWKKTSREGRDYVSVKLDDPSFAAPIFASLVEGDDGHSLISSWTPLTAYLQLTMAHLEREAFRVLFLDKTNWLAPGDPSESSDDRAALTFPEPVRRLRTWPARAAI